MAKAARDAYEKASEADKPQLAGMAIKISYFLEAIDRYCISGILQGERESSLDIKAPDFLSAPEKEKFCYLLNKEEKKVTMVADRTIQSKRRKVSGSMEKCYRSREFDFQW